TLRIIITERLCHALRKAKITNVRIEPLTEVRMIKASVDAWMQQRTGPYLDDGE
ncbi:MAG: hypothetical protein IT336_12645, partial [Thermomicrobiales bacterium]|nr:hypothetical protein [Thermomicrobiales bacterium]